MTNDWLEKLKEELKKRNPVPLPEERNLDNLAYTVYSSGTTGKPKGRIFLISSLNLVDYCIIDFVVLINKTH